MKMQFYVITGYFAVMHLGPLLSMVLGKGIPIGGLIDLYTVILLLFHPKNGRQKFNNVDYFVILYIIACLISGFGFLKQSNPFSIDSFFIGVHVVIFPLLCYFVARRFDEELTTYTLECIFYLNTFAMLIGLILYFTLPAFYINYEVALLSETADLHGSMEYLGYARLASYFGSQLMAIIGPINPLIFLFLSAKRAKPFSNLLFAALSLALASVTSILSMQRAGFICIIVTLLFYLYYVQFRRRNKFLFTGVVLLFILGGIYCAGYAHIFFEKYAILRITSTTGAFSSRWEANYTKGWNYITDFPFGFGLGATSLKARSVNNTLPIGEANIIRIATDTGFQGIIIFLLIIFSSFTYAIRNRNSFPLVVVIMIFLVQSVGTNSIDSFYVGHIFWLILGIIASQKVKQPVKNSVQYGPGIYSRPLTCNMLEDKKG